MSHKSELKKLLDNSGSKYTEDDLMKIEEQAIDVIALRKEAIDGVRLTMLNIEKKLINLEIPRPILLGILSYIGDYISEQRSNVTEQIISDLINRVVKNASN